MGLRHTHVAEPFAVGEHYTKASGFILNFLWQNLEGAAKIDSPSSSNFDYVLQSLQYC